MRSRRRRQLAIQALENRNLLAGTVTGRIWVDSDFDGQQDAAETQIANATVRLVQSGVAKFQATSINGIFTIPNVPSDQIYHLQFNLPTGYTLGPTDVGNDATDNDFDVDSTAGATVAEYDFLRVADGQTLDVDAGIVQGGRVEVFTWNDVDGDGIQDATAPESTGLANVSVTLKSQGNSYASTGGTSDAHGSVVFSNVRPGTFSLQFSHSTFARTLQNQGANDTIDSDADPATGTTAPFLVGAGSVRTDVDAGFRDPNLVFGTIKGMAWLDNGDGIRQASETGLTGVHVLSVYRSTDNVVGNADDVFVNSGATNASQAYSVSGLSPGKYYVLATPPSGYGITLQDQGANDTIDSDFRPTTHFTSLMTLTAGSTIANVDVGFLPGTASIGNFIWADIDKDGIQDPTETGIAGAVVKLFNATNTLVQSPITTNNTGLYTFSGLQPGQYRIEVTPPLGYIPTLQDEGLDDALDSDLDRMTMSTEWISLAAGSNQSQWDIGLHLGGVVGDKVWLDNDFDGQQDATEPGKAGVGVRLKSPGADGRVGNADDILVASTSTSSNGSYLFRGLYDGPYYVEFVPPTNYVFTHRDRGSDLTDSDAGLVNGRTSRFTIVNASSNLTIDAGLVRAGTVKVHVGPDVNNDGVLEPGSSPVPVDVYLIDPVNGVEGDSDDVILKVLPTNNSGDVTFSLLQPRTYYIRVNLPDLYQWSPPNQSNNESNDSDIVHLCSGYGNSLPFSVSPAGTVTVTAGLVPMAASLEGVVWDDANRNRIRDGAFFQGSNPDIVLAIDISASTTEPFAGTSIGDVNGDGMSNTILDAEILAGISLIQQLQTAGLGNQTRMSLVAFGTTAVQVDMNPAAAGLQTFANTNANADGDATLDCIEALMGLRASGGSNFESALQKVVTSINSMGTSAGRGNLLFLTDGSSTAGGTFTDEVATLKSKQVAIRAMGLTRNASMSQIRTIDSKASSYASTDDFFSILQLNQTDAWALESGMEDVRVYLDLDRDGVFDSGIEPSVLTSSDDADTDGIDESGRFRFDHLAPGTYIVREVTPAGYVQTLPGTPGLGWQVTVTPGRLLRNADFGNAGLPVLANLASSITYRAGGSDLLLAPQGRVSDPDSPALTGGGLVVRFVANGTSTDRFSILSQGTGARQIQVSGANVSYGGVVFGTVSGGTGVSPLTIQFNSQATPAAVQALVRRIAFRNTAATIPIATRSLEWKLTDQAGGGLAIANQSLVTRL